MIFINRRSGENSAPPIDEPILCVKNACAKVERNRLLSWITSRKLPTAAILTIGTTCNPCACPATTVRRRPSGGEGQGEGGVKTPGPLPASAVGTSKIAGAKSEGAGASQFRK